MSDIQQSSVLPRLSNGEVIYGLTDPFTHEIRYVGKSIRPSERFADHCKDKSKCHRTNWIQSVIAKGKRPGLIILQRVPWWASWQTAERMWIQYGLDRCWPLTNSTLGGDGVVGLTQDAKDRIAAANAERKASDETKRRIGAASRGRRHTEEYKLFMRDLMRNREFSQQHRDRLSASNWQRLPDDIREAIVRRLAEGARIVDIAAEFGVHRMTVSRIKNNRKN